MIGDHPRQRRGMHRLVAGLGRLVHRRGGLLFAQNGEKLMGTSWRHLDRSALPRVAAALAEILIQAGEWESGMDLLAAARTELGDAHPELKAGFDAELAAMRAALMAHDPALIEEFDSERGQFTARTVHGARHG